jgi:hypothetical protein
MMDLKRPSFVLLVAGVLASLVGLSRLSIHLSDCVSGRRELNARFSSISSRLGAMASREVILSASWERRSELRRELRRVELDLLEYETRWSAWSQVCIG